MNSFTECFDDLLCALEANADGVRLREMLNERKMKGCLSNCRFRDDVMTLFVARDCSEGIRAVREIYPARRKRSNMTDILPFIPFLSGKEPDAVRRSCAELAANYQSPVFENGKKIPGYRSLIYMFIVRDCYEALKKYLDISSILGLPSDCFSEHIRIAAKRHKTEYVKLFTERGFVISCEDMRYLERADGEYAKMLLDSGTVTVPEEKMKDIENMPRLRNPYIRINQYENPGSTAVTGNIYNSSIQPDGQAYSFEASSFRQIGRRGYIVYEGEGIDKKSFFMEKSDMLYPCLYKSRIAVPFFSLTLCSVNANALADVLLPEGGRLSYLFMDSFAEIIDREGENYAGYIFHRESGEITPDDSGDFPFRKFRRGGRAFYKSFHMLEEIYSCIMSEIPFARYKEKITGLFSLDIEEHEKYQLMRIILDAMHCCKDDAEYAEAEKMMREYGFDSCVYKRSNLITAAAAAVHAGSAEVREEAVRLVNGEVERYSKRFYNELQGQYLVIPLMYDNIFCGITDSAARRFGEANGLDRILCFAAEKRRKDVFSKFGGHSEMCGAALLEMSLRSPDAFYDFIGNNFPWAVPAEMRAGGRMPDPPSIMNNFECSLPYRSLIRNIKTSHFIYDVFRLFDTEDKEYVMEHMEKISSMIDDDITELEACCFRGAPFLGNRDEELIGFLDKIFACEVKVDICGDSVPRELYGALPGHRFIQTVYNIHNFCELPENVTSVCGNEDEVIENAILCDNEAEVHMAAEYGILNEGTADRAVKCAVENKRFKSLKAINDIFGREVCEKE